MATQQFKEQFRKNSDLVAAFAGYRPLVRVNTDECRTCGEEGGHSCSNCGHRFSEDTCRKYGGFCVDCFNEKQWLNPNK